MRTLSTDQVKKLRAAGVKIAVRDDQPARAPVKSAAEPPAKPATKPPAKPAQPQPAMPERDDRALRAVAAALGQASQAQQALAAYGAEVARCMQQLAMPRPKKNWTCTITRNQSGQISAVDITEL